MLDIKKKSSCKFSSIKHKIPSLSVKRFYIRGVKREVTFSPVSTVGSLSGRQYFETFLSLLLWLRQVIVIELLHFGLEFWRHQRLHGAEYESILVELSLRIITV